MMFTGNKLHIGFLSRLKEGPLCSAHFENVRFPIQEHIYVVQHCLLKVLYSWWFKRCPEYLLKYNGLTAFQATKLQRLQKSEQVRSIAESNCFTS